LGYEIMLPLLCKENIIVILLANRQAELAGQLRTSLDGHKDRSNQNSQPEESIGNFSLRARAARAASTNPRVSTEPEFHMRSLV
jgi:hypothetical protein